MGVRLPGPDVDPTNDCLITFPANVKVLMYPAGTWVKGSIDVINIDAVYDSTGLEQNIYTALFVEEGILAVQRCTHTCAVDDPGLRLRPHRRPTTSPTCLAPPDATAVILIQPSDAERR